MRLLMRVKVKHRFYYDKLLGKLREYYKNLKCEWLLKQLNGLFGQ